ncbi:MAG TPA: ATP-binding protein [Kofleriaceae bacterium]|nr:ATP-binding protein [Kofleriaceae bacterium]
MEGELHLILGPVGAGKSTFARALGKKHRAVLLILDDWMAQLFGADARPATGRVEWYIERRDRCLEQIWKLTVALCEVGTPVVLELGLIRRAERDAFYRRVEDAGYELTVYLLDAPREVRRERVLRRNEERGETFAQVVPPEFFELASDLWEPPDDDELNDRSIRAI